LEFVRIDYRFWWHALWVVVQTALIAILSLKMIDQIVKESLHRDYSITPHKWLDIIFLNNLKNSLNYLYIIDPSDVYFPQEKHKQFFSKQNIADCGINLFNYLYALSG